MAGGAGFGGSTGVFVWSVQRVDPQLEGWPLTAEERAYVVKRVEHDRRPGRESLKHLPKWLFGEMAFWGHPSVVLASKLFLNLMLRTSEAA